MTGPYDGPLFDTHLHLYYMYMGTPTQLSRLRSAGDLLSYLDRGKVDWAIGFYILPPNKSSSSWVSTAETIISGARSRVIPLLQPSGPWSQFVSGQFTETVLRQYLHPQGLLRGVGEIVLSKPELQSVTFDSPQMQTVFQVVNELKGIVMIHPSAGPGVRSTELAEIEPAIRKYPDTIFLFHPSNALSLVAQLMDKYPNVYYTMDVHGSLFFGSGPGIFGAGVTLYPSDAGSNNAESFLAAVNRVGLDHIVEENLKRLTPWLQQYPDRIFWGTDLEGSWHFEQSVTDVLIRISRQFIGGLPADVQEKYAYQNALRVFGRFFTPNP